VFWTFAEKEAISGGRVRLGGETGHHLARVRRIRPGEAGVVVSEGQEHHVTVERVDGGLVVARVTAVAPAQTEPPGRLVLLQALLPNPDFDAVIEAGTALGVAAFWPIRADRSISRPDTGRKKRWQAIARSAAEQSHRGRIPEVNAPAQLGEALRLVDQGLLMALDPRAKTPLWQIEPAFPMTLAVGPEGGWTDAELKALSEAGGVLASLGPRILRARLAPIAAAAIVIRQ
jgi:16S rRNA (uracil1498-N3)-methyltransferase